MRGLRMRWSTRVRLIARFSGEPLRRVADGHRLLRDVRGHPDDPRHLTHLAHAHATVAGGRRAWSSAARDADQPSALLGGDQYPHRRSQRLTQIEDAAFPLPTFV